MNLKRPRENDDQKDFTPSKRSNSPNQKLPQTNQPTSGQLVHGRDGVRYTIGNPKQGREMRRSNKQN